MATGTIVDVPNQPKTPNRTLRIPDDEWAAWKAEADRLGVSLTDFLRATMNNRVKRIARKRAGDGDA
ncbi:ribbon-helix-helix DNA binding domain protein [Gordonia phage Ecliptus]|nr:ribbon-helix-helix DNA binding domain protein [Gordonia phage Ecliptus]